MDFNNAYRILINAVNEAIDDSGGELTPPQAFDYVIDKGIVYSEPTPGVLGIQNYVLGSVETYLKYAEAAGFYTGTEPYNVYASVETYLKILEAIGAPNRVSVDFMPLVEKILDVNTNDDGVLDKGIVESGNYSILRIFLSQANTWSKSSGDNYPELSTDLLSISIDKGVVIGKYTQDHDGVLYNEVVIASIETYLKWLEAAMPQPA
jgi:hypothetical protein